MAAALPPVNRPGTVEGGVVVGSVSENASTSPVATASSCRPYSRAAPSRRVVSPAIRPERSGIGALAPVTATPSTSTALPVAPLPSPVLGLKVTARGPRS